MLSNAYFLAKFCFDTAENEPAKNLQNFANFATFANPTTDAQVSQTLGAWGEEHVQERGGPRRGRQRRGEA